MPNPNLDSSNTLNEDLIKAVKTGDEAKVRMYTQFIDFNFFEEDDSGKTLLKMAEEEKKEKIIQIINEAQKIQIEKLEKLTEKARNKLTYEDYCITLRKAPNNELYRQYLRELLTITMMDLQGYPASAKEQVLSRKIWSDIVSETYQYNQETLESNDIKASVIDRLKKLNIKDPEKIYELCIEYIVNHSVVTLTFKPGFLRKGLNDFQPLNMWEKDNRNRSEYTWKRERTEADAFNYLSDPTKEAFLANMHARPRYAALLLLDSNNIHSTLCYGNSFILLKDVILNNSVVFPGDSLNHKMRDYHDYQPCTIQNLEFLLWQCPEKTLEAIATRVQTGHFPDSYTQNIYSDKNGGYIEVLAPAFNFFDKDLVQHIYIDRSFSLDKKDMGAINDLGISISNQDKSQFASLTEQAIRYIVDNEIDELESLLKKCPPILKTFTDKGLSLVHVAAQHGRVEALELFGKLGLKNLNSFIGGRSPLQLACQYNQLETVRYLIERLYVQNQLVKSNYLDETLDGWTTLHLASMNGHSEIVWYLIKYGANVNFVSPDKNSILNYAAKHCNSKAIKAILICPGVDLLRRDNNNQTALSIASSTNDIDKVKVLLEQYKKLPQDVLLPIIQDSHKTAEAFGQTVIADYLAHEFLAKTFVSMPINLDQHYKSRQSFFGISNKEPGKSLNEAVKSIQNNIK